MVVISLTIFVGALGFFPYCAAGVDLFAGFTYPVPWLDAFMKDYVTEKIQ
jgi:hypothetical protein